MPETIIHDNLAHLFRIEIRNEAHGGVSPATLSSALDSIRQAPHDVLADWIGEGPDGITALDAVIELATLIDTHGGSTPLADLI